MSSSRLRSPWRRTAPCAILIAFALLSALAPAQATPFTWGNNVKPQAWPKNSTINVFVQTDPKGLGRDALVKAGVERWTKALADRMITLKVTIGDPPASDTSAVRYTWEADGFKAAGQELGTGTGKVDGIGTTTSDGTKLVGGSAHLRNALPAGTDQEKEFLRNLGEHELTHVLGLADDAAGAVTKHEQPSTSRGANAQDIKEINTLYGTANSGGGNKAQGQASRIGGGAAAGYFDFGFQFLPGNAVADPLDPEHVPLITLDIDPALVLGVQLPPGWLALVANGPIGPDDPYFVLDDYMADGGLSAPPWDPASLIPFLAFRASVEEALADGLPPGIDPALTLDNPQLPLRVFTVDGVREGPIRVWAGGEVQTVLGPRAVSEPATLLLMGAPLLLALGGRGKSQGAMGVHPAAGA